MAERVQALHVAVAAGVLLVGVLGADVALNRTVQLDVDTDDGWRTLATLPPERNGWTQHGHLIEANRSDDVSFRVAVDNQRLDAFEGTYEVRQDGQRLASGSIAADRLGTGEERFTVPAEELLGDREDPDRPRPTRGVGLELLVSGETTFAWLEVQEVAR